MMVPKRLANQLFTPEPGCVYQHYKGNTYRVLCCSRLAGSAEDMVTYRALYEDKKYGKHALWTRPRSEFTEMINNVPRFKLVPKEHHEFVDVTVKNPRNSDIDK